MRILFSFTIAFLFTILAAGVSSAQVTGHLCQEDKQANGAMDMAQCNCSHVTRIVHADLGIDAPDGGDCCLSAACGGWLTFKEVAFESKISSSGFFGIVQSLSFFQPKPMAMFGAQRTGLPPPQLPSAPLYIQNCSFLI